MLTGVTASTVYQLGAGVLCTSYTSGGGGTITGIIGATRGGGSFAAVPTIRSIPADGIPDNVVGWKTIDFWTATLSATLIETTEAAIKLAIAGASASTSASVTTITPVQGIVASGAHAELYWVGDTQDGKKIAIKMNKALNNNGFNLTFADRGEGTYAVELIAHYEVSSLSTPPFSVIIDKSSVA